MEALGPGVNTAYRQGRCAYQMVLKDSSPENFHAWRKRAKIFVGQQLDVFIDSADHNQGALTNQIAEP